MGYGYKACNYTVSWREMNGTEQALIAPSVHIPWNNEVAVLRMVSCETFHRNHLQSPSGLLIAVRCVHVRDVAVKWGALVQCQSVDLRQSSTSIIQRSESKILRMM
jgi:hypothetical protein